MLERGTIITKYYPRRRPEQKTLMLRRETRQLIWSSANNSTATRTNQNYEGALELREIKEVRIGKISKEFEKWSDESKCVDFTKCFVIFYGSDFKLRSLSVVGEFCIPCIRLHCERVSVRINSYSLPPFQRFPNKSARIGFEVYGTWSATHLHRHIRWKLNDGCARNSTQWKMLAKRNAYGPAAGVRF